MSDPLFVGVDLGGTNIKTGVVDTHAQVITSLSIETEAEGGPAHIIGRITRAIDQVIEDAGVDRTAVAAVGVGAPGSMDYKKGVIITPPNLPGWRNVPLRSRVREACGIPTTMDNDANAAAWGEFWAGAGRDVSDMVMFTLGTGVGGGLMVGGRLVRGHFDNAAELGHIVIHPDGMLCACGQKGCLEAYSSAGAVGRRAVEAIKTGEASSLSPRVAAGEPIEAHHVVQAAQAGDAVAERVWDEACMGLALAIIDVQHYTNPQRVVLAGGMMLAGDFLVERVRKYAKAIMWQCADDLPEIELATLGNDAGLIGAAGCAHAAWKNNELPN